MVRKGRRNNVNLEYNSLKFLFLQNRKKVVLLVHHRTMHSTPIMTEYSDLYKLTHPDGECQMPWAFHNEELYETFLEENKEKDKLLESLKEIVDELHWRYLDSATIHKIIILIIINCQNFNEEESIDYTLLTNVAEYYREQKKIIKRPITSKMMRTFITYLKHLNIFSVKKYLNVILIELKHML